MERLNQLHDIIEHRRLWPLFQPIVSTSERRIIGYEALIRGPSDSPLHSPIALFETAVHCGRLVDLETLCGEITATQFKRLKLPGKLFLNASPASLFQPDFRPGRTLSFLRNAGVSPASIVIELTEQHPLDDYTLVRKATEHYKSMGFEIAIDDLGAGYAGLRMWSELRPDYVKIDRHFIQGIHEDLVKQEFVRSIQEIAHGLDCKVIAEGIETRDEYSRVCALGIGLGQGYYFSRPHPLPPQSLESTVFDCIGKSCGEKGRPLRLSEAVSSLMVEAPHIAPSTSLENTAELFRTTPSLESIPVVDNGIPVGLVRRNRLMDLFLSHFGKELHGKKAIALFMENEPLIVEHDLPVEEVSQLVTDNLKLHKEHDFIIAKRGRYLGVGLVMDLLKKITELQIRNARYSNPLTLLPGNVPIYEMQDQLLTARNAFHVCYCDLDNFKPFNDLYGYGKGDQIIKQLANILVEHAEGRVDFVGHIGGDDFIVIFQSPDWRKRCQAILKTFAAAIPEFYDETHREAGGIWAKDRRGNDVFHPLLSLSIGAVKPDPAHCHSHHDIASLASNAKREAKKIAGNSLFVDRRTKPTEPNLGGSGQQRRLSA